MKISAILPVFCGEAYIGAALDSIAAQTHPVDEVVVIDDGSTDGTARIVQEHPLPCRYIHQPNGGAQIARNRGLAEATGDVLAFLDADDLWHADKLRCQISVMAHADVVIGQTRIWDDPDSAPFLLPSLCCALFRRRAFDLIGEFDPELAMSDDLDWYLRAREAGLRIALHDDVVLYHRRHEANMTRDTERKVRFHLLSLRKSVERRRASGNLSQSLPRFEDYRLQGRE